MYWPATNPHAPVARETLIHVLARPLLSPEDHVSRLSAISCAHTAPFQLKAFCAASGRAALAGAAEQMGSGLPRGRENEGPPSLLPRQLDVTVTSHGTKSF